MSGGGGGHIIRSKMIETGNLGSVRDKLTATQCAKLDELFAKETWTDRQFDRVCSLIKSAYKTYGGA